MHEQLKGLRKVPTIIMRILNNLISPFLFFLQTVGLGKLRPNIVMMGYKSNWHDKVKDPKDLQDYFNVIQ